MLPVAPGTHQGRAVDWHKSCLPAAGLLVQRRRASACSTRGPHEHGSHAQYEMVVMYKCEHQQVQMKVPFKSCVMWFKWYNLKSKPIFKSYVLMQLSRNLKVHIWDSGSTLELERLSCAYFKGRKLHVPISCYK